MATQIGEGSAGSGAEAVRVTTVLGDREGPVGTAWATAIATPSMGHSPFVVVAKPNLPVVPVTLLVPAVGVSDQRHADLTMGAAQAGVAAAVLDLQMDDPDGDHCLIVSVWVDPDADSEEPVFDNTRDATIAALKQGAAGGPWHPNLTAVETPENPRFRRGR
ncbi:MAG: formaldehyde-activating enzyme [Ilumatobacter sp.]|nr:formaldehyde-activating enzyme [Ilumatobacter sp.]